MVIPRAQQAVLAALNLWVDLGLPADSVAQIAASHTQGDPRGTVKAAQCQRAVQQLLRKGWMFLGPPSDKSRRTFAYTTKAGIDAYTAVKEYWEKKP
jgi:hypothetical protein